MSRHYASFFQQFSCWVLISLFVSLTNNSASARDTRSFGAADENSSADVISSRQGYTQGVFNGIQVLIPNKFLQSGVMYSSPPRDVDNPEFKFNRIAEFGILLRISNLSPVTTEQDRRDWRQASSTTKPSFLNAWMMVDFDSRYPIDWNINHEMPANLMKDPAHTGPFIRDEFAPFGLHHYTSVQPVDNGGPHGHMDYFYSDSSLTNIVCETNRTKVPPLYTYDECHHRFLVPELHVVAEAFYTKNDLKNWKLFEEHIRLIAKDFISK